MTYYVKISIDNATRRFKMTDKFKIWRLKCTTGSVPESLRQWE